MDGLLHNIISFLYSTRQKEERWWFVYGNFSLFCHHFVTRTQQRGKLEFDVLVEATRHFSSEPLHVYLLSSLDHSYESKLTLCPSVKLKWSWKETALPHYTSSFLPFSFQLCCPLSANCLFPFGLKLIYWRLLMLSAVLFSQRFLWFVPWKIFMLEAWYQIWHCWHGEIFKSWALVTDT